MGSETAGVQLMSTRKMTMLSAACLIACASAATAQTSVDKSFTAVSKTCDGIQWSEAALARYPTIAEACQGVEERNGKTFVKFEGTVKRNVNKGEQLVVNFKDAGDMTLTPPPETNVYINGQRTPVSKLSRGDELNFYIAEDRLAAQIPETESQTARLIVVPITPSEPAEEQMAALPATASPLPLFALAGFLSLGLGGLLNLYRRRR
jgi:LPXTG-motif cell wall-anchored protein